MDADIDLEIGEDDEDTAYVSGSNLFADLGRQDAAEMDARSQLLRHLFLLFRDREFSELQVAEALGVSEAVASDLMNLRLSEFSTSQLFGFLDTLGYDARITLTQRTPGRRVSLRRKAKARR